MMKSTIFFFVILILLAATDSVLARQTDVGLVAQTALGDEVDLKRELGIKNPR